MRSNRLFRFALAITLGALVCVGQVRIAWSQNEGDTSTGGETNPPTSTPVPGVLQIPNTTAPTSAVPVATMAPAKPKLDIIEFQNAPVTAVLDYYARLTNRSVISAPNLAGNITFRSQTNLTLEEAIQALDTVLAVNGIAVLPQGEKFLKVVQIAAAPQEGPQVGGVLPAGDALVTQVIPLKYADAQETIAALQSYSHPYGKLLPLVKSNSILITETGGNIHQMLEIVKYLDQPSALRMETKIYILAHAKAADVVQRLQAILQEAQQLGARAGAGSSSGTPAQAPARPFAPQRPAAAGAAGTSSEDVVIEGKTIITPDDRTNKIFVFTRPSNLAFFDQMIAELDSKIEPDVITKVIALNFAEAQDIASLLNSLISGGALSTTTRRTSTSSSSGGTSGTRSLPSPTVPAGTASSGGGAAAGAGLLQYAEGVRVLPDPRTNSLLIMATKEDMERIEALIHSVDTAVSQVLIEVVIGEVTLDNELDVGVNLIKRLFKGSQVSSFGGTTTGGSVPAPTPQNLSGETPGSTPIGATLSSALTYYATFRNLNLDVALQLLASTSKFRVLSTPIIQTLDNKEGTIKVGESRPIITSQLSGYTTVSTTNGTANGLQSNVEYKDIAIELTVTPRINPDGYVTMDIDQKVNDIGGSVNISGNSQPIITTREAKSSVTVKNQSTIVLGGLIKEQKGVEETKVPFLGDIPFLGHLFKNKRNTLVRDELIVFIRPTVLRNDAEAVAEARRRSKILKVGEELGLDKWFIKDDDTNRINNAAPDKASKTETNRPAG
ncbi:MAG: type II secretion system secretin GspD [Verrucomicrobiia bacterium]